MLGRITFIALIAIGLSGCDKYWTDADGARKALEQSGFSAIQIGGYEWFACSRDDAFHTSFTAKGPTGLSVKGVVCRGVFKSSTIRFDS